MFQTNIVDKINTHFVFSNFFFPKIIRFMRPCGKKYRSAGQATDDDMAHAHCMLDN